MGLMTDDELKAEAKRLAAGLTPATMDDLEGANPVLVLIGVAQLLYPNLVPDWSAVRHFMDLADEMEAAHKNTA